jgi:hypothetical protein
MTIEQVFVGKPTDCIFKMISDMQSWNVLRQPGDKSALDWVIGELRSLDARIRAST